MIYYEGLFFDGKDLDIIFSNEKKKLDMINDVIHCTFKYKPKYEEIFDELVGNVYDVYLVGYACDDKNSGFLVSLDSRLKKYYINTDEDGKLVCTHITCSIANNASSSDTKNLDFKFLNEPIKRQGKFGYYIKDDNGKTYVSYKKFKSDK